MHHRRLGRAVMPLLGATLVAATLAGAAAPASADDAPSADLVLTTTPSATEVDAGDSFTYVVTLTDESDDDAPDAQVAVTVPSGWTYVSDDSADSGTAYAVTGPEGSGTWSLGTLGAHSTASLVLTLQPVVAGSRVFRAVASSSVEDPHTTDDAHSDSVRVLPTADMSVTTTAGDLTPMTGGTVSFTARAWNAGPDPATDVVVSAPLPPGYSLVSDKLTLGTYDPDSGTWTVGSIQPGSKRTLSLLARVDTQDPGTFTASVASAAHEPDSSDNTSSVTVTPVPLGADLRVTQDPAVSPPVGGTTVLTEHVTNAGPYATTGVHLLDQLSAGLQVVSSSATSGTYDPSTGEWDVPSLADGETATLSLTVQRTRSPRQSDHLVVLGSDLPDPVPADDAVTTPLAAVPVRADLSVTASATTSTPMAGTQVGVTVTVSDLGPAAAQRTGLTVVLPAGLAHGRLVVSRGWVSQGVWHLGTMLPGASATLTVTVRPRTLQPVVLSFAASSLTADPAPGNGQARVTLTATRR